MAQRKRGFFLGLRTSRMANGKKKASIIKLAAEGPVTNQVPASLIQQHSNGILMIDKEAATGLEKLLK